MITLLAGVAAFLIGLLQYRQAQKWKRSEWVANEMEKFFSDPAVASAFKMIDYGSRKVALFLERPQSEQYAEVHDLEVAIALQPNDVHGPFDEKETAIRDIFDRFLERLERIYSFLGAGLVTTADVRPYLYYWAKHILAAQASGVKVHRLVGLKIFMGRYDYVGAQRLLVRVARRPFWSRKRIFDFSSVSTVKYMEQLRQRATTAQADLSMVSTESSSSVGEGTSEASRAARIAN